ncbi:MAG: hypothetical protein NZM28_01730, partial [Fimbriimonadales bacterium]|nr:hypothetical protein [Fimbriimonadales bacterium]
DLDRLTGHAKAQTDAFKQNLDNFLLTNFLEFRLYRGGECVMGAKLSVASASPPTDVGADPRVCPEKGHAQGRAPTAVTASPPTSEAVLQLLTAFLSAQPLPIRTPNELAIHLARRTRQLKHALLATLEAQLKQPPDAPLELRSLYRAFQETLLPELTPAEFADLYAQTIAYGLFAARCQMVNLTPPSDKGTQAEFKTGTHFPDFPALFSNLTPLAPLSARREGGMPAFCTPTAPPLRKRRGGWGMRLKAASACQTVARLPQTEATKCTLIRRGLGGEGWSRVLGSLRACIS